MGSVLVLHLAGNVVGSCHHLVILQVPALRMRTVLWWRVVGQDAAGPGGGVAISVEKDLLSERGIIQDLAVTISMCVVYD